MTKSRDVRSVQTKLIKASECISEVFVRYEKLSEENKKLKKQLEIAIGALNCYGEEHWTYANEYDYIPWNEYTGGWCHAEKALEKIKELDK